MNGLDWSDRALTVRLSKSCGVLSTDAGQSVTFSPSSVSEVMTLLLKISEGQSNTGSHLLSATAQGSLAEAFEVRPIEAVGVSTQKGTSTLQTILTGRSDNGSLAVEISDTEAAVSGVFSEVVAQRRSNRNLHEVPLSSLASLLVRTQLVRGVWVGTDRHYESNRPTPSAGARHPHALVVISRSVLGLDSRTWVMDPERSALMPIELREDVVTSALSAVSQALRIIEPPPAVIFTVARPDVTLDRYPSGMSLIWRDAGALQMLIHLTATDLGLGSCIAGTSGVLFQSDGESDTLVDTGAIVIGMSQ
jgi:SagB-type dehydrogenase family enzyme